MRRGAHSKATSAEANSALALLVLLMRGLSPGHPDPGAQPSFDPVTIMLPSLETRMPPPTASAWEKSHPALLPRPLAMPAWPPVELRPSPSLPWPHTLLTKSGARLQIFLEPHTLPDGFLSLCPQLRAQGEIRGVDPMSSQRPQAWTHIGTPGLLVGMAGCEPLSLERCWSRDWPWS